MPRQRPLSTLFVLVTAAALTVGAQSAPQTRQLRANGTDLSYVEQGTGAPIVFVHGAVADHRFWEPQREAFAKGHRFVAYTYRYHGTAPWPDDGKQYSADLHAADLAAFISGLKAGPVHLVGLSYGGFIAAMVALKQPQLLRSLTLAEPALFTLLNGVADAKPALDEWSTAITPMFAALKEGDAAGAAKILSGAVNGQPADTFDRQPEALRQILLDNARTLRPLFAAAPTVVTCESLATVKVPTLVVRGETTPGIFVKTNEAVGRCISGSRLVVVPKAAHAMSYQNPQGFNEVVLDFIRRVGS